MKTQYDEITLSSYIDGELDTETMHAVDRYIQENEDAKHYILQTVKVNAGLRAAMNATLHEEIPQRLLDTVKNTPKIETGRFSPLLRIAAAVVLVFIGLGAGTFMRSNKDLPFSTAMMPLPARYSHVIEEALENNVSGKSHQWQEPRSTLRVDVTPVKTYRDKQGTFYREYRLEITSPNERSQLNGVAYRDDSGRWQTKVLYF